MQWWRIRRKLHQIVWWPIRTIRLWRWRRKHPYDPLDFGPYDLSHFTHYLTPTFQPFRTKLMEEHSHGPDDPTPREGS